MRYSCWIRFDPRLHTSQILFDVIQRTLCSIRRNIFMIENRIGPILFKIIYMAQSLRYGSLEIIHLSLHRRGRVEMETVGVFRRIAVEIIGFDQNSILDQVREPDLNIEMLITPEEVEDLAPRCSTIFKMQTHSQYHNEVDISTSLKSHCTGM